MKKKSSYEVEYTLYWLLYTVNILQITSTKEALQDFQSRPQRLVAEYIKRHLHEALSRPPSPVRGRLNNPLLRRPTISIFTSYEDDAGEKRKGGKRNVSNNGD